MGQFANTFFRLLLGWVQTAVSWLWGAVTGGDGSSGFRWMMDHWLLLLVLLCLGAMVIDFVVYLFRWQPYRVWRSFFQRMKGDEPQEPEEEPRLTRQRKWVYADGSTALEDVAEPAHEDAVPARELEAPIRPVRRFVTRTTPEQAYNQPVYPPQWPRHARNQGENE